MMIYLLIISVLIIFSLIWLIFEYGIFLFGRKGLPVLMYHKVSEDQVDGLTISTKNLEQQFKFIRRKGYQTLSFHDLSEAIKIGKPLPRRPLILTFDDAYHNFLEFAVPMLKSYGYKASVFIPVGYIGKTNAWDQGSDSILSAEEIRELTESGDIEFGLHSFLHRGYAELDPAGIEKDIDLCIQTLSYHKIPFVRVIAYPYGSYPKKDPYLRVKMDEIFRKAHIQFALRIGNRINHWPPKDPYTLKRIDIKGTDTFYAFKTKLSKGRRKLFS
ncbi:MAG: polysaccharide deacetylase family protein [Bacteroidales bacterium]|jgi:peptidoglycan/xylan/chitin deacetylase (PgdA/CDA1 family)